MEVTFYKLTEQRVSTWEAVRKQRIRIPGSTMALGRGGMPHDLVQLVVEATVGLRHGFWGCVADGATFKSTGRKRTRSGRAVIAAHRAGLDAAERVANDHVARWQAGKPTPCAPALDEFDRRWRALDDGEGLSVEWPTLAVAGVTRFPARTR